MINILDDMMDYNVPETATFSIMVPAAELKGVLYAPNIPDDTKVTLSVVLFRTKNTVVQDNKIKNIVVKVTGGLGNGNFTAMVPSDYNCDNNAKAHKLYIRMTDAPGDWFAKEVNR